MKEKLYKKEIRITVDIYGLLLMLTGHSASIFVLFPGLQQGTLLGFSHPVHHPHPAGMVRHCRGLPGDDPGVQQV
jgi:hypothetical protein